MRCKYCNEEYTNSVHVRWCKLNPFYSENRLKASKSYYEKLPEMIKKIKQAHKNGKYDEAKKNQRENPNWLGRRHSKETREKMSNTNSKLTHRRLCKSTRLYSCKDESKVLLDSSWEEVLAKRLDELDIKWVRPKDPIPYELDGKIHNYFPDFYLTDYDIFLDPKNPFAIKVQKKKLDIIKIVLPNLVILESEKSCREFEISGSMV